MTTLTREDIVKPLQHKRLGPLIHREDADKNKANIARQELALKFLEVLEDIKDTVTHGCYCDGGECATCRVMIKLNQNIEVLRSAQGEKKKHE